jgi:signal transduction histidine kinase
MSVLGSLGPSLPPRVTVVVVAYVAGGVLGLALTGYAVRGREKPVVRSFGVLALLASVICLSLAGRVLATDLSAKLVWNVLAYVGWVSIGPAVAVFALRYVGTDRWVTRGSVLALAVLPAVTLALVALGPDPPLHYTSVGIQRVDGWPVADLALGPWFWVHALYEYGLILFGVFLLARYALGTLEPFRTQAVVLAGSFLFMLTVNVVYLSFGLAPFPGADLTPLGLVVGLSVIGIAVFRVRLVDVVPVARDRVFLTLTDPVVVVDGEGRVVDTNEAAAPLLRSEEAGRPVGEVLPAAALEAGLQDGSVDSKEIALTVDGADRWYLVRRQWVDDRAFALVFTDVTERHEREAQLEEFASVVSHDLRNPLSVAKAHVELAGEADDAGPHLEEADVALDRIDHIVEELLTLTREGDRVTDPAPVDLERVAREAWGTVTTDGATLVVDGTTTLRGDYGRIRRAFENLFRNSVEHGSTSSRPEADDAVEHGSTDTETEPNGGEGGVTVTVGPTEDGFAVEDDGPGVPADLRERVFDRGYTTETGGTGLGLAIVARMARAHGWSVELVEADSGGARFEFRT